jgi:ankyrin repeat protein
MSTQVLLSIRLNLKAESLVRELGNQLSVEARDKYGKTLLMIACQVGAPENVLYV